MTAPKNDKARKQCKKCPWKVSTDPYELDGEQHERFEDTLPEVSK